MNIALLFSFGFVIPILELHLLNFHISNTLVSLCFLLQTFTYGFFCFVGSSLFKKMDDRVTISIGIIVMGISYAMLAPWGVIFPKNLWIVLASLPLMGLGQAMIYRNFYTVPTYPHMIKSATQDYGYSNDDVLVDSVSGLSNIACNIGEILGPIFTGVFDDIIGFENTSAIVALSSFVFGAIYIFGSGLIGENSKNKKTVLLSMKIVAPEN